MSRLANVEIRLAVLDAVVAREISALKLIGDAQTGEDLFQDVGDGELLEDPALVIPREHPEPGNDLRAIAGEGAAPLGRGDALALGESAHDPVEVARGAVGHQQGHGNALAEDRVERDRGGGLGQQIELESEQPGDGLFAGELLEEQDIGPERRRHGQEPIRLTVLRHGSLKRVAAWLVRIRTRPIASPAPGRQHRECGLILPRPTGALQPSSPALTVVVLHAGSPRFNGHVFRSHAAQQRIVRDCSQRRVGSGNSITRPSAGRLTPNL